MQLFNLGAPIHSHYPISVEVKKIIQQTNEINEYTCDISCTFIISCFHVVKGNIVNLDSRCLQRKCSKDIFMSFCMF